MAAEFYVVPLGDDDALPAGGQVRSVPLGGDWEQGDGSARTGSSPLPNEGTLLIVNSTSGILYRVDPATGDATAVDLGGETLETGDGMLRDDETLYVVRNRMNQVDVVMRDETGGSGEIVDSITSPDFDVPTTVAEADDQLYLPNARFGTTPTPDTTYSVVTVPAAG